MQEILTSIVWYVHKYSHNILLHTSVTLFQAITEIQNNATFLKATITISNIHATTTKLAAIQTNVSTLYYVLWQ